MGRLIFREVTHAPESVELPTQSIRWPRNCWDQRMLYQWQASEPSQIAVTLGP
jgi:hypothetical protein